jgi:hypothetical protein
MIALAFARGVLLALPILVPVALLGRRRLHAARAAKRTEGRPNR